jgi:uncharacterized membrane protein
MDSDFIIDVVLRYMHIFAAIAAVGGTFFARLALLPAMEETLSGDERAKLHGAIRSRWSKIVAASIGFLLVSGLINYVFRISGRFDVPRWYHPVFGVKFLLALGLFFIASVLSGRSSLAERFRKNARFWLTVNMTLAILIVCLSGALRFAPRTLKAERAPGTADGEVRGKTLAAANSGSER